MDYETPAMPPKIKRYPDAAALLAKLEGRGAMWHRAADENRARAEEFDQAAQLIRDGETSVTVGRTTYTLSADEA
jgi:hypothetical protein